ncbi:hypothetical protein SAMN05660236_2665 [Ohtaekwangia koreensis]|uniref:Uncharacterized protein n=1 Tax=Ohtaekwangia koreensis TaxID=688867 RepID=A0A1T5L6V6_9BACT|nr:hypothetical protein SAMN05660236_2665 [Ohtaekwangia koreensis]
MKLDAKYNQRMLKEKLEYFFKTGIECGICRLFERVVKRAHQAENTLILTSYDGKIRYDLWHPRGDGGNCSREGN